MSLLQVGSLCEDCLSNGLQNYLKSFYINLEEKIIKCESSQCMFPYLRKSIYPTFPDSKDCILSLDDFVEEKAKHISTTTKAESSTKRKQSDEVPIMLDFFSLFMDDSVKTEDKTKATTQPIVQATNSKNPINTTPDKADISTQPISPPKARISRCLMNVKSNTKPSTKKAKSKGMKAESVFVIEPESGKCMRPLDLIGHYIKTNTGSELPILSQKK